MSKKRIGNQVKALKLIADANTLTQRYIAKKPDEVRYTMVLGELKYFQDLAKDHWPLTQTELSKSNLGLFAVRELEGIEDDLADILVDLDWELRGS